VKTKVLILSEKVYLVTEPIGFMMIICGLDGLYNHSTRALPKTSQRLSDSGVNGTSMLFEAAIGELIPTTIHANRNIKVYDAVVDGHRVQVLLDRHQFSDSSGIFDDVEEYADLCFYLTINYWMMGDTNASMRWFRAGEKMWDYSLGKGFYDKAVYDVNSTTYNRYQNSKLGLFLLAQKVTGFPSDIVETVEATAWSYQNDSGGITTQSELDGRFYGTANAEATASLLLVYNSQLTDRLNRRQSYAEYIRELTEAQLNETLQTIDALTTENSKLRQDNLNLRDSPWLAESVPSWFVILLVSTFALAISSCILVLRVRRLH
jgi:hypothetical protein